MNAIVVRICSDLHHGRFDIDPPPPTEHQAVSRQIQVTAVAQAWQLVPIELIARLHWVSDHVLGELVERELIVATMRGGETRDRAEGTLQELDGCRMVPGLDRGVSPPWFAA